MDNDAIVLKAAAAAATSIDLKYRQASFSEKLELKQDRDKAFNAYSKARRKLLEEGVICTQNDVEEMKSIRQQIGHAKKTQSLLMAVGRLIAFLVKVAT